MRILTFLLFVFCALDMMAHGGHIADFTYQIESKQIVLEFKIENAVLDHFDLEETCENYQAATAMCLMQYIKKHTSLTLNDKEISFELHSSKQDEHFFSIKMIAEGEFAGCNDMRIKNDCFYEYDRKFSNRIIIQKEDTLTSYLLNRKHKKIIID